MTIAPIPGSGQLGLKLAGAVLPKLIGGLFGGGSKKRKAAAQYQQQKEREAYSMHRRRFRMLSKDAKKGGFNPLTALSSGLAGMGAPTTAVPSMVTETQSYDIGDAASDVSSVVETERTRQSAKDQLASIEKEVKNAGGTETVTQDTVEVLSNKDPVGMENVRPYAWADTSIFDGGMVRMRMPSGHNNEIPQAIVDRLNGEPIGPGSSLIIEDFEATLGEEMGQAAALPQVPAATQNIYGGLTGYDEETRREVEKNRRSDSWREWFGLGKPTQVPSYVPRSGVTNIYGEHFVSPFSD